MGLHQKTLSVPNLNNKLMSVPQPPPPPPPLPLNSNSNSTLSTTSLSSKTHIYSSPNNIDYSFQQFNNHKTTNGAQISAYSDTLV